MSIFEFLDALVLIMNISKITLTYKGCIYKGRVLKCWDFEKIQQNMFAQF